MKKILLILMFLFSTVAAFSQILFTVEDISAIEKQTFRGVGQSILCLENTSIYVVTETPSGAANGSTIIQILGTTKFAEVEVDLSTGGGGTDDQTAAEVPFTPTGNILSSDVQSMGEELQTQIDAIQTTSGVVNGATNLGTFSGSTISDNTTTKAALQELETAVESGGGGGNLNNVCEEKIFKVAHGFSVGNVIYINTSGNWVLSQANAESTIHDAIVISVTDADNFTIQFCGIADITGQTYSAGVDYYTSEITAGDLRNTAPTAGYVDFVGVGRGGTKLQLKDVNAIYTGSEVAASTLEQEYPGASVLYSLRLLDNNYTGNAVRVRRDNDDAEQDIGFTNGIINETALTTFCGANSCYVTIWYDKSVNGNNAVQVDNAKQPIIVNSGVVEKKNNLVTITATGSQTLSFNATVPDDFTETSVFAVFTDESTTSASRVLYDNSFSAIDQSQIQRLGSISSRIVFTTDVLGNQLVSNYTEPLSNSLNIYTGIFAANTASLYMNTSEGLNIGSGFALNSSGGHIFSANEAFYWVGSCSELVVYPDDRSLDRNGIETNLNDYYATY